MTRTFALAVLMLVVAGAAMGCRIATVRPIDEQGVHTPSSSPGATAADPETPFDAAAVVAIAWDRELLPAIDGARDVNELGADEAGLVPVAVRGGGRVVDAHGRSRAGTATVELDGGRHVVVQVGPVLTGTALRDALPSLGFDSFVNQIQHADVGNELNARVEQQVLARLDRARLPGARLSFAGMARRDEGGVLTITPVRLAFEERP